MLAGIIDWGGGWLGLRRAWELLRLKRAATDERLFGSGGGGVRRAGAVKVKREGVIWRVCESVDW